MAGNAPELQMQQPIGAAVRRDYARRYARIIALKQQGLTSAQIGARLGMSAGAVRECISSARHVIAMDEKPAAPAVLPSANSDS